MKIIENTERDTVAMLVVIHNLEVRRLNLASENVMGRRENVM